MTDTRQAAGPVPPSPDALVHDRYRLVDRVADAAGTSFWRAVDERLARTVGLRLMPLDGEGVDDLRAAAVAASRVTDRRAVPVLDVVDDDESGHLVVVTEWAAGTSFTAHLLAHGGDPLAPDEAARIALEVARFLAVAEAAGVPHGHLRPSDVMVTESGEVRVRGLGVERALYGVEPPGDPALADVHGAGAILFAGLTGRWPGPVPVPELPLAPPLDRGRTPWPSRVIAEVPPDLDRITARALRSCTPPKGMAAYSGVGELVDDLAGRANPTVVPPLHRGSARRTALRTGSVVVATLAAVGLAGLGLRLLGGLGGSPLTSPRAAAAPASVSQTPTVAAAATGGERDFPVVAVHDFDPYGDTKQENPDQATLATDDNPASAWRTVRYKNAELSGKPGVGLILDLGAPRPVSLVDLRLVGNGTDVTLLATDDPRLAPAKMTSMAEVTGAGDTLTLRVPSPVSTRYLLVWLTHLPSADGSYQGGISDVRVRG